MFVEPAEEHAETDVGPAVDLFCSDDNKNTNAGQFNKYGKISPPIELTTTRADTVEGLVNLFDDMGPKKKKPIMEIQREPTFVEKRELACLEMYADTKNTPLKTVIIPSDALEFLKKQFDNTLPLKDFRKDVNTVCSLTVTKDWFYVNALNQLRDYTVTDESGFVTHRTVRIQTTGQNSGMPLTVVCENPLEFSKALGENNDHRGDTIIKIFNNHTLISGARFINITGVSKPTVLRSNKMTYFDRHNKLTFCVNPVGPTAELFIFMLCYEFKKFVSAFKKETGNADIVAFNFSYMQNTNTFVVFAMSGNQRYLISPECTFKAKPGTQLDNIQPKTVLATSLFNLRLPSEKELGGPNAKITISLKQKGCAFIDLSYKRDTSDVFFRLPFTS